MDDIIRVKTFPEPAFLADLYRIATKVLLSISLLTSVSQGYGNVGFVLSTRSQRIHLIVFVYGKALVEVQGGEIQVRATRNHSALS
jgi:hypothetical protein